MAPPLCSGVMDDCRRPPGDDRPMSAIHGATIEQALHAERLGVGSVWFTGYHLPADGHLPASRVRLSTDIAVLPLDHPVRPAEERS